MRIFYASTTTPNSSFQSDLWRNNLYLPLVDLGHDVVEFDYDMTTTFKNLDPGDPMQRRFIDKNRPRLERELMHQIRKAHEEKAVDLFFSYFYSACATPATIEKIRDMGITTANWYCNGAHQFHLVEELAPAYDWCLVPEKVRLDDYRRVGARPIYCQEAANPKIYRPYDVPLEYDVTFVGQAYGERPAQIQHILDSGIDVRVWGWSWDKFTQQGPLARGRQLADRALFIARYLTTIDGWYAAGNRLKNMVAPPPGRKGAGLSRRVTLPPHVAGEALDDEDMIRMYSRSRINLGFSACGDTHKLEEPILQVRLRDFEVPMSGGFYMVKHMEELEEFFEIGKEIVCYTDRDDMVEKIRYYLAHDDEREAIREAGYRRCLRDHTWHKRFETVFREMGLTER